MQNQLTFSEALSFAQDMRLYEFDTVEDSVVCNDDKLSTGSSAAFVGSCDKFLRSTAFGNSTGWPTVIVAPSFLVDSDEAPNLAIEVTTINEIERRLCSTI